MSISERARPREMAERSNRIVTEADCEKALSWLRDNAHELGEAKRNLVLADKMVGHVEALMSRASEERSDEKRKADARSSDRYLQAINDAAYAAGEYEKLKALREAAALKIETWRSEQANYRAMRV